MADSVLKVALCQPLVPSYRVPIFSAIGDIPGIDLTVFAGSRAGSLAGISVGSGFKIIDSPVRQASLFGVDFRFQYAQVRVAMGSDYQLVILPWDIHYLSLAVALVASRIKGMPIALWGHGYSKRGRGVRDKLRNFFGRMASSVIVYSRSVRESLIQNDGFDGARVFVAENAIDQAPIQKAITEWLANTDRLARFRSEHHLDPSYTVIFVSRLEAENRIEMLVDALKLTRERFRDCRLVIVGDGSHKKALEAYVKGLGLDECVVFTGAIYEESLLAPWMLSSAFFSYPVNIGLSLMHAFGYGLPVVTSDNLAEHNPEIDALRNEQNGLLYRDGDVHDLAKQWSRLLNDPVYRNALAQNARVTVEEGFNLPTMVSGFRSLLSSHFPNTVSDSGGLNQNEL